MWKRILVAIDTSPAAQKALQQAITLSAKYHSHLTIMAVGQIPEYAGTVGEVSETVEEIKKRYVPLLETAKWQAKKEGVEATVYLAYGNPAAGIYHYTADHLPDLLIMGNIGTSNLQTFLLGNVSSKMIQTAPCDVLVVK